jgi:hypothetical protein
VKASMRVFLYNLMRRNRIDDAAPVRVAHSVYDRWAAWDWHRRGEPAPPPYALKRKTLVEYARRFGLRTFVETGTCYGDTVFAVRSRFDRIISIELDHALHEAAKERLKRYEHIILLEGDSGALIAGVLAQISEPTLFWLDAHYSGGITARGALDSPISFELDAIIKHPIRNHVILIDDAREFIGDSGYPELTQLRESVVARRTDLTFEMRNDIIRIHQGNRAP